VSGGIISKNIRRFGRTTKGVLEGVRWLEDRGAVFIPCEEKLDTSTPMGRFVLTILAALGQMELEERAVGWKTKRDSLVLSGKSVAKIPFGYAKGERGELVPDPKTRDYLVGVFQRRATGQTWTQIADWLQDEGVPKRYSTASWKQTDVAKLAANDVYLGIATNGDVRNENAHKALVSPELWYAVKGIRDNHRSKNAHSKIDAPLGGGYVRCSSCGVGLTRTTSTERDGKKYGFYICRNPECRKSSISAAALEPYVYEVIAKTAVLKVEEPYEADAARDAARQAVETAQAAIQGFDATWADQGLDPVAAISMRKALEVRLDEARKRLADLPVDVVDWRTQVRKTYEEWSQTLGIEFDPEDDVRVIEKQFTEGVTGAWLYELLADGGETAREVVRQNLKRVVVTGKSATPGKPESRKSVEARVEVEVIP